MNRFLPIALIAVATLAESGEVYLKDGVTDGDTFYLSNIALTSDDPALQSWVSYSLTRSACQLQIGGENPARASSFECELMARQHLVETWLERRPGTATGDSVDDSEDDDYLAALVRVDEAGYLDEYVAFYLGQKDWTLPDDLQLSAFSEWRRGALRGHKPQTHLIGSWNYAERVNAAQ